MKYVIEGAAKEEKKARNGDLYRSVKIEGLGWVNVMHCPNDLKKGDCIFLTEPKTLGKGTNLWAFMTDPKTDPNPEKQEVISASEKGKEEPLDNPEIFKTKSIKTISEWEKMIRKVHAVAKSLEPEEGLARTAICNTVIIAWTENKLILDSVEKATGPEEEEVPF